ncbi:MAG TPA: L-threonylcarbamoyladenylate synthase [Ilumatobacteraceae bacterium]|nr:L-threonylcarbamoyladenylate synthase [Ilumatobacteraceae bacterium]
MLSARVLISTDIERAVEVIRTGGLVAMPTETVYGLAADATNPDAVRRIFAVKGRPADHPLIVHLGAPDQLSRWVSSFPVAARRLTEAAWPGPLTIILPRANGVLDVVTGGLDTVGVRIPAHALAAALLERVGVGLAAPSANRFGAVSPTNAEHVLHDLGDFLDPARDLILDGGECTIGVESTIVDFASAPPQILRAGGVAVEDIRRLLDGAVADASGPSRASGMLPSHYAPNCTVRLVDHADDALALRAGTPNSEILDLTDDLVVYAHDLYARLRDADARGIGTVIAVLPPPIGLGYAIRDRLAKAAAPR